MAISEEQMEFVEPNYETLIQDLIDFPKKYEQVDKKAIENGEFDLETTILATVKTYFKIKANTFTSVYVISALQQAIDIIYSQGLVNLNIPQETVTSERMRPTLYQTKEALV